MLRPSLTDLMRAADDLVEACDLIADAAAPPPEVMAAERLMLRSIAILKAHIEHLVKVDP